MNLQKLVGRNFAEMHAAYTKRDTMLYGLGVAACQDPLDPVDLSFVYEEQLQALPSMTSVLAHPGFWVKEPALELNWLKLVHAEQRFDVSAPLPVEGEVIGRYRVKGVVDKGVDTGAMMYFEKTLESLDGTHMATINMTYFFRGDGGCGNWGEKDADLVSVPTSPPDGHHQVITDSRAALMYRLSGDYNPLHADPEIAKNAGFDRPILHGLCTYGVACHSLVRAVAGGQASRLTSMAARFTKPVMPGETLRTEYWRSAENTIQFRCIALERNEVVLDRGSARLN